MGKLEDRENRRRASVVGAITGMAGEKPGVKRGRPKADWETKKRVSLSVRPSLYGDVRKIAYVQRRSVSEVMSEQLERFRKEHHAELQEYESLTKGNKG